MIMRFPTLTRLLTTGLVLLALLVFPAIARAQAPIPAPAASSALRAAAPSARPEPASLEVRRVTPSDSSSKRPPTHRTEGAIIGAVVLGGAALALGLAWGNDPDAGGSVNWPVATLTGAALGGIVGAMIGGAFPKEPPKGAPTDSSAAAH